MIDGKWTLNTTFKRNLEGILNIIGGYGLLRLPFAVAGYTTGR